MKAFDSKHTQTQNMYLFNALIHICYKEEEEKRKYMYNGRHEHFLMLLTNLLIFVHYDPLILFIFFLVETEKFI